MSMPADGRPDSGISITAYAGLNPYIKAFADGKLGFVVLIGPPGVQKSWSFRKAVGPEACWIEGHVTPLGLYTQLWMHRDEPVVIDDVDELYANATAVRILKCLCQTDRVKRIAWSSLVTAKGTTGLPLEFSTTSPVAIIANKWETLNRNVAALEDRGHVLFFEPTALEVHKRTAEFFTDQEVFDFIGNHLHLISRPSMRYYVRALELKEAQLNWRSELLKRWLPSEPIRIAAQILADPRYTTEEARVEAFVAQGGGCRATYFNHKRNLQSPQPVSRILLKASVARSVDLKLLDRLRNRMEPYFPDL